MNSVTTLFVFCVRFVFCDGAVFLRLVLFQRPFRFLQAGSLQAVIGA